MPSSMLPSSLLLSFFNGNAYAYNLASCLLDDGDERHRCLSVGKEIIHDEHLVLVGEIWARHKHIVMALMGE